MTGLEILVEGLWLWYRCKLFSYFASASLLFSSTSFLFPSTSLLSESALGLQYTALGRWKQLSQLLQLFLWSLRVCDLLVAWEPVGVRRSRHYIGSVQVVAQLPEHSLYRVPVRLVPAAGGRDPGNQITWMMI